MARDRKLIVEEMLTKPSGVCPMLFVGLGGAGCKMVARIASHLRRRPDFQERFSELIKFAMIDTNVNDLESYREVADQTFLISDFEKEEYANLASGKKFLEADEYFTQWVPPDYRFRAGDTAGAGQIRIESRLGVYYQMKHKDFVARFRHLLEQLKSHEHGHRKLDSDEIRIVLCYSIAGGTGSGCHLPVAYTLRDQAADLGRPILIGVSVMPAVFEDKVGVNKDGTFANGYAALKETEHLMKLGAPDSRFFPKEGLTFHYNPADTSKRQVFERPFDFLYLVDKPKSFSVPEPVEAAADGLYLQFFSPLYGAQLSDYDNYTQYQRFLVPNDFDPKGIQGFSTFYGSYGCAVLLVPVPGLVEYCSRAAALALIRESFLGEIPGDPVYQFLRSDSDAYFEVTESNDEGAQTFQASEIPNQSQKVRRDRLYDRLFAKRVRLLAACEFRNKKDGRFRGIFRHGHYFGTVPKMDGSVVFDPEVYGEEGRRERELAGGRIEVSIGGILLPAIVGMPHQDPGLLKRAHQSIKDYRLSLPRRDMKVRELKSRAKSWQDDFRAQGLRRLREGYSEGHVRVPGMEELVDLSFLRREAGEVDLAAKRYAVLSILDAVDWDQEEGREPESEFDTQDKKDTAKVRPDDPLVDNLVSQAQKRAFAEVRREFLAQLGTLKARLEDLATEMRDLEQGSVNLERDYSRKLERLQLAGEESANQYVLDAEALQGEDNRRFWDFYFEDKIAGLQELSLSNERVQQILSDTVIEQAQAGARGAGTSRLERLFTELRKYAKGYLEKRIGGDRHSPDQELRQGLTLSDALELELTYRALYRSHHEEIQGKGGKVIRRIIAEYRALPEEKQIDFADPQHQDYLRDKIKRVVKEKASLLCVYEPSKAQHGGVRPDEVFLAAIDENFKNSNIEEALKGADIADLQWVSGSWHNAKEIVFYRAVLNVPLYAFGRRLGDMKHHYDRFRQMSRRSKALHIDRNWEGDGLPDLDPDTLKEEHRQGLVRDQIINFTALMCAPHPEIGGNGEETCCIVRRQGKYLLLNPNLSHLPQDHEDGVIELGDTLAQAIQELPQVLKAQSVSFKDYHRVFFFVRNGLAPELLERISALPRKWRKQYEELANHYGRSRPIEKKEILKDLKDSYHRLQEALDSLLQDLRNRQLESQTLGEDFSRYAEGLDAMRATKLIGESVRVLSRFREEWGALEDPLRGLSTFQNFYRPLRTDEFHQLLGGLISGEPEASGGAESEDSEEQPAVS